MCKYFEHIKFFSFYEKESNNVTFIPSWYSADDVQYTVGVQCLARAKSLALLTFGANFKYLK